MKNKTYEDFKREAKRFNSILRRFKETGEVFVDKNFHPSKLINENKINDFNINYKWERLDKYYNAPLFDKDLIGPDYIVQGNLGDCYFISSLSRVAVESHLVKILFDTKSPTKILGKVENSINIECGAVVVYFYCFGRRTPVLIDTLMPTKNGYFKFSHPSDKSKSAWFCLVEKAYAKLKGSYSNIVSGLLSKAIYSLFGYYPVNKKYEILNSDSKKNKMPVFDRLMKYQRQGSLLSCSIHDIDEDELKEKGLISNHEYLIIKVRKHRGHNLICLRNPWGHTEWNGDWSKISPLWTEEMKKELSFTDEINGTFWMNENDFFYYFNEYSVSKPIRPGKFSRKLVTKILPSTDTASTSKFTFQVKNEIPENEECKIYIVIEKVNYFFDFKGKIFPKYKIVISQKKLIFTDVCNSENFTFPYKLKGKKPRAEITFKREGEFNYTDDLYVLIFCDYDFDLVNEQNPEMVLPKEDNPAIVFNNKSDNHSKIALPLIVRNKSGKSVLDFASSSYNITYSDEEKVKSKIAALSLNESTDSNINLYDSPDYDDFDDFDDSFSEDIDLDDDFNIDEKSKKNVFDDGVLIDDDFDDFDVSLLEVDDTVIDEKSKKSASDDDYISDADITFDDDFIIDDEDEDEDDQKTKKNDVDESDDEEISTDDSSSDYKSDGESDKKSKQTLLRKSNDDEEELQIGDDKKISDSVEKNIKKQVNNNKKKIVKKSSGNNPMFYDEKSVHVFYRQLQYYKIISANIDNLINHKIMEIDKENSKIEQIENEITNIKNSDSCEKRFQIENKLKKLKKQKHQLIIKTDELTNIKNKLIEKQNKIKIEENRIIQLCDKKVLEHVIEKEEERKKRVSTLNFNKKVPLKLNKNDNNDNNPKIQVTKKQQKSVELDKKSARKKKTMTFSPLHETSVNIPSYLIRCNNNNKKYIFHNNSNK